MDKKVPILSVKDLEVGFDLPEGRMMAVKKASFEIFPGKTLALVGESGSGKSVISQSIMGLLPSQAKIYGGSILFSPNSEDKPIIDIAALNPSGKPIRDIRGGQISIIFQEPMTSLSPLHTIGNQILEALMLHRRLHTNEATQVVIDMLGLVGFPDPKRGFKTLKDKSDIALFNLDRLQKIMKENKNISNSKFNISNLQKSNLLSKKYKKIKILGSGELKEKFDIEANFVSKSAKKKIEDSGGKITLIK